MEYKIHEFDNGVKVYDYHLNDLQRKRYERRNVHEADEEDIFIQIMKSMPPTGCFISIGSAIGYYPILAKRLSPNITIHAFEPLKIHREYFAENVQLNAFNSTDFFIHDECVSISDGWVTFFNESYGSKILKENAISIKRKIEEVIKILLTSLRIKNYNYSRIKTISLDKLLKIVGDAVDLVQMDIEGLEVDVLNGGLKSLKSHSIKTFLIGSHSLELHKKCINILRDCGYFIEFEEHATKYQPDGIIVGTKGTKRLRISDSLP